MSRFTTILFDLDGTLVDTRPGIMASLEHTFDVLGMPMYSEPDRFLGPPLPDSFRRFCGMNEDETAEAVRIFRKRYSTSELFNAELFPGIGDMLRTLRSEGYTLAAATCKVEGFAREILEHFGIAGYFDLIGGSDERRTEKADVIRHVLANLGEPDKERVLMVGDRDNDVNGARAVGIPCLYALWGYGSPEEAAEYGADATAETPADVVDIIRNEELGIRN